jgi:hypothetical protein
METWHGLASWIRTMDNQHKYATWTCSIKYSMDIPYSMGMQHGHGYEAWT